MKSLKKGIFVDQTILDDISKDKTVFTKSRSSTIVPEMFNKLLYVYNGKKFIKLRIITDMVGHKLGEFIPTRVFKQHTSVTKKSRMKVKK